MSKKIKYLFTAASILWLFLGISFLHYYIDNSQQVALLVGCYLAIFIPYGLLAFKAQLNAAYILIIGVVIRASLLFAPPSLSDDSFRYYWDGQLLANGVNPYSVKPSKKLESEFFKTEKSGGLSIYQNLNSKSYYSVYPPVSQGLFAICAKVGGSYHGFILVFRILIILAELLTGLVIIRLLKLKKISESRLAIYFLNPLIIIELSGNLHGEVFMVLFVALTLLFYQNKKYVLSGTLLALAFATKLYPLVFAPLFVVSLSKRNKSYFSLALILTAFAVFAPLISINELKNINESLSLYYDKFEFNGSVYSLLKTIGIKLTGYNQIAVIGKILMLLFISSSTYVYYLRFKLKEKFSIEIAIYLLVFSFYIFSTTVMPWYLALIVFASVFSKQKAGILWSAFIVLTYSAFANNLFNENPMLVFIEYLIVGTVFSYELFNLKKLNFFELNK